MTNLELTVDQARTLKYMAYERIDDPGVVLFDDEAEELETIVRVLDDYIIDKEMA